MIFSSNGDEWRIQRVAWDSPVLVDRTGHLCIGVTDPHTMTIYLADWLEGELLARVMIHEMAHAVMWSNGLIAELGKMVKPDKRIEAEEWVCNFLADYGMTIFEGASKVLGGKGIDCIPQMMRSLIV